ncbi:MAG: arginine--tRNA ligase, partial [Thermosulfidibacteraceae bacterium]
LEKVGFEVTREYYINDAGKQVKLLGESILARMYELTGGEHTFPEDGYKGKYIYDLAKMALNEKPHVLDMEKEEAIEELSFWAVNRMMERINNDLRDLGIEFDVYFSERTLYNEEIKRTIEELEKKGYTYEKDGAIWFKSTPFGDEKDRVLIRSDGTPTYFASDIAYHRNKFLRNYDFYINVWGADHHGYIKRVKGAIKALGFDDSKLDILLIQMVNLVRNGKPVTMSKREGEIVTLRWLLDEVGKDAIRFIFLTRKQDAHLDFDISIATKQTEENPVFYVQYAHARICSIYRTAMEKNLDIDLTRNEIKYSLISEEEEIEILKKLAIFPDIIEACVKNYEPHRITFYLMELASLFHSYYNRFKVLEQNDDLRIARVALCEGVRIVIKEGLRLIGVSAPEVM